MTDQQQAELVEELSRHVLKGDYRHALSIAKRELKKYPTDFVCRYQYAKLLGDWADELPEKRKRKLKSEAAAILKPLTRALTGRSIKERFGICLNYYYQTEAFLSMYRFGTRFSKTDRQRGLYAKGLGACLRAEQLYKNGKRKQAMAWAAKSNLAWRSYDLKSEKYYFAHYSASKALALAGEPKSALSRLEIAARLSGRKLSDWEFADVLGYIAENQKS